MPYRLFTLLFCALFALSFGGVGIGFGLWPLSRTLHAAWSVQSWEAVPAQVLSSELEVLRDSDGTTHRARVRYRYSIDGQFFESERIGLDERSMADNFDDWHANWHRRLTVARANGQPVLAWVNPSQPSQALLDPDIRWSWLLFHLPFAFVFTGVGLGATWVFARTIRTSRQPVNALAMQVRNSASQGQAALWIFALFWSGIAFPVAGVFWLGGSPWWVKAFLSIFVLVGIGLLWLAGRQSLLAWRFAGSAPQWHPSPPMAGQGLTVTLDLPARAIGQPDVQPLVKRLRLAHYRVDDSGSGASERLVEHFDATASVLPDPQGGERWVARFDVPQDAPSHGGRRSGERVDWRLEVLDGEGKVLVAFDVPVQAAASAAAGQGDVDRFDRGARWSREEPVANLLPMGSAAMPASGSGWPVSVRVVETPDAYELHFSQSGWRWLAAMALTAAVLLSGLWWDRLGSTPGWQAAGTWRWWLLALLWLIGIHAASRRRSVAVHDDGLLVRVRSWMMSTTRSLRPVAFEHLFHKLLYAQGAPDESSRDFHAVYTREAPLAPPVRLTSGMAGADSAVAVARALLAARADRLGRFSAGASRSQVGPSWRPGPGWILWAVVLVALSLGPRAMQRTTASSSSAGEATRQQGLRAVDNRLMDAQDAGDPQALAAALSSGADPDLLNASGSSMLMLAAYRGQLEHVDLLLRHGATPDLRQTQRDSERGDTALLRALYGGHLAVARRLVEGGASLRVKNRWDWGPAHMAAQSGCVPCLGWLAELGVPMNEAAPASRGETPAMLAAARGQVSALAWFEANGIDLWVRDPQGKDALDWARWRGQQAAQDWLQARAPSVR